MYMKKLATLLLGLMGVASSWACTNFLVTRGASTDGSTFITYAADSHTLYGELYFTPAATHPEGAMVDIYEWDTGKFLVVSFVFLRMSVKDMAEAVIAYKIFMVFPAISAILNYLAIRAIGKDEALIRSIDRIR